MLSQHFKLKGTTLRAGLAVACLSFVSTGALAGTVITNWDFTLNNGFTAFTDQTATIDSHETAGSNGNTFLEMGSVTPVVVPAFGAGNAPSLLTWGQGNNTNNLNPTLKQSSLNVGATNGHFAGSLVTDALEIATVKVTHSNNQISSNTGALSTATLTDVLSLTPTTPAGSTFNAPALTFGIDFEETSNSGTCPTTSSVPCDDVFLVDVTGAGFVDEGSGIIALNQMIMLDVDGTGVEAYNVRLRLDGLAELTETECQVADASHIGSCFGLVTEENTDNFLQAYLSIQHKPGPPTEMPEPSGLAALGFGLLGLGIIRRRRKNK